MTFDTLLRGILAIICIVVIGGSLAIMLRHTPEPRSFIDAKIPSTPEQMKTPDLFPPQPHDVKG